MLCRLIDTRRNRRGPPCGFAGAYSNRSGLLAGDLVVERLVVDPPGQVVADLLVGQLGVGVLDAHHLAGGLGQELDLGRALHGDEPPGRRVHGAADREQAVVTQDDGLVPAERRGDPLALPAPPSGCARCCAASRWTGRWNPAAATAAW
jgi:hypothetical protein